MHIIKQLPYASPIEHRQAVLVQTLLLALLALTFLGGFIPLFTPLAFNQALTVLVIVWLGIPIALAGIWLLHIGRFTTATLLTCVGLILLLSLLLIATGAEHGGAVIFGYALPIVLAGLVADRRLMLLSIGLSGMGIALAIGLERLELPLVGIAAPRGENSIGILGGFLVIAIILGVFVIRLGEVLRAALADARQYTEELEQIQASLEDSVTARTTELRTALAEIQSRAEAQARLLDENTAQRTALRTLSVPVLPVGDATLVVPLVGALDSLRLQTLQTRVLYELERSGARRLLIDINAVPLVDNQVAHGLLDLVAQVRLLGAEAALIGIRPEVAQALVALGDGLLTVQTYRDLEAAISARG